MVPAETRLSSEGFKEVGTCDEEGPLEAQTGILWEGRVCWGRACGRGPHSGPWVPDPSSMPCSIHADLCGSELCPCPAMPELC